MFGGFAGSYPEWKWTVRLGYSLDAFDIGATWRYVDSMRDGGRSPYVDLGPGSTYQSRTATI